jgi:integrase
MARFQRGSLRKEARAAGQTWVYRYYCTRDSDGKRVERTLTIGLVRKFPSESSAWAEVNRLDLHTKINKAGFKSPKVTFGMLAQEFTQRELADDQRHLLKPRSHTTVATYRMYLQRFIRPRWDGQIATKISHHAIQDWLQELKRHHNLANRTVNHLKGLMALVYKFGAWRELIPDSCNPARKVKCVTTSEYEPKVISPEEAHRMWSRLKQPESTLVLLVAVTGLRISEALALKWSDIDPKAELIHVKRSWTMDRIGKPKSKASRAAVPCVDVLAKHLEEWRRESPYSGDDDWVFASFRNKGKTPRSGSILVTDYLKKAAYDAGVLKVGEKVQFGMHNLRHSLATYLIAVGRDIKTVQTILRHANPLTTLQLYAHGRSQDRSDAQGDMLTAFFKPPTDVLQ